MHIKLFAIMGGSWMMECVQWFTGDKVHKAFGLVFDIFNALRGLWLLIFCVFLSKRVRTALIRKFNCMSAIQTTLKPNKRHTVTVSLSKGSQSENNEQVEMNTLVSNR